tara:strand:+ start:357 stop:1964 length:1608 start_codon:yes stop_codon:yes gene_type:complete
MNGLQDLIMFRDNIQQPEMTGMDNLRNLQSMTMQSMADQQYANMAFGGLIDDVIDPNEAMRYAASGGIVSLPLVQAGFGGFLKKVGKVIGKAPGVKLIGRTIVRPLSKSKTGRFILSAAPMVLSGGNPALAAAIAAGIKIAQDPNMEGNPYKVLQSAGKAYAGAKIGQAMKGAPGGSESYAATAGDRATQLADAASSGIPTATAPAASSSIFGDIGKSLTDVAYDPEGTVFSRLGERVAGTGQFENVGLREQLGLPPAQPEVDYTTGDTLNVEKAAQASFKPDKVFGSQTLGNVVDKAKDLVPDTLGGKLAAGSAVVGGLSALQGQPEEQPQYDPGVYDSANIVTNFDKERMVYLDKVTGEEIPTQIALSRLAEAYRSFNPRGKLRANIDSGIKTAFQDIKPLQNENPLSGMIDLKSSGGLIGMAYGGQMPQDNLDVRYKEFSGMVGGQGDGMEDNVYMPIIERDNGQQVATLAVSPKEYVVDANTMSLLGNGNPDAGAKIMDATVKDVRMAATGQRQQQKEIDGLQALNRMRRV